MIILKNQCSIPYIHLEHKQNLTCSTVHACSVAKLCLTAIPWTVARQSPLSMGFSRQEYWRGLPFPSPEDFPDPGIKPGSPALEADALTSEPPGKPLSNNHILIN